MYDFCFAQIPESYIEWLVRERVYHDRPELKQALIQAGKLEDKHTTEEAVKPADVTVESDNGWISDVEYKSVIGNLKKNATTDHRGTFAEHGA